MPTDPNEWKKQVPHRLIEGPVWSVHKRGKIISTFQRFQYEYAALGERVSAVEDVASLHGGLGRGAINAQRAQFDASFKADSGNDHFGQIYPGLAQFTNEMGNQFANVWGDQPANGEMVSWINEIQNLTYYYFLWQIWGIKVAYTADKVANFGDHGGRPDED